MKKTTRSLRSLSFPQAPKALTQAELGRAVGGATTTTTSTGTAEPCWRTRSIDPCWIEPCWRRV